MSLTMHEATILPCVRALTSLGAILGKAEAYAAERKIDPAVLLGTRLFPDMLPLSMQIVIARGGAARLAGVDVPAFEAGSATFPELIDGIDRSVAYLGTLQAVQFVGAEERTVTWSTRSSSKSMQGVPYLFHHVLPNVYFHVTTAYAILRHTGLAIGKKDYLGG
jgi:hypothetical protein